jgi:hypothetical protein
LIIQSFKDKRCLGYYLLVATQTIYILALDDGVKCKQQLKDQAQNKLAEYQIVLAKDMMYKRITVNERSDGVCRQVGLGGPERRIPLRNTGWTRSKSSMPGAPTE